MLALMIKGNRDLKKSGAACRLYNVQHFLQKLFDWVLQKQVECVSDKRTFDSVKWRKRMIPSRA